MKREALEAVGGFDPGLGMVAGRLGLGEETELATRLVERYGNATWHAPRMGIDHLEPAWKQRPGYVARRAFVNGRQAWRYAGGGRGRKGRVQRAQGGEAGGDGARAAAPRAVRSAGAPTGR